MAGREGILPINTQIMLLKDIMKILEERAPLQLISEGVWMQRCTDLIQTTLPMPEKTKFQKIKGILIN